MFKAWDFASFFMNSIDILSIDSIIKLLSIDSNGDFVNEYQTY